MRASTSTCSIIFTAELIFCLEVPVYGSMANRGVIMVHAGAGYHSPSREQEYRAVCEQACKQAIVLLRDGRSALEVVVAAVKVLEDNTCTNAGVGSALTLDGTVECDASAMDGQTLLFGAVGAVSGVQNPVCVACELVKGQKQKLPLGRIPPSVLVGAGARKWALQNNCEAAKQGEMITESSKQTYCVHKRKLEHAERVIKKRRLENSNADVTAIKGAISQTPDSSIDTAEIDIHENATEIRRDLPQNEDIFKREDGVSSSERGDVIQDTVGAVCLDSQGNVSAAVSSGGISLKSPGRIGQAAVYGAGCWAENTCGPSPGVAVSTSGCGEHIMRTLLARECASAVRSSDCATLAVSKTFNDSFLGSRFLTSVDEKMGGVIIIKHVADGPYSEAELVWAHTTDSMCIGYMEEGDRKPKSLMSRLPEGGLRGKSFNMQGKHFCVKKSNIK